MIKTIAIDLDGVLNTYCGNYNENEIAPPKEGVHEFLAKLAENYKIEIFTVRNTKLTAKWLIDNDLDRYVSTSQMLKTLLPAPSLMTELSGLTAITTKPYKKLLFLSHIGANFSNTLLILIF